MVQPQHLHMVPFIIKELKMLQIMTIIPLSSIRLKVNFTEFHLHQKETICL